MAHLKIKTLLWSALIVPVGLALIASVNVLTHNLKDSDIIALYIAPNFSVLITQSLLLIFMMWQVLIYRSISELVIIRHKSSIVQKNIILLVSIETFIYISTYYASFIFTGNRMFIEGNTRMGISLLFLRFLTLLIFAFLTASAYRYGHSMLLIIGSQILNLIYHYWLESTILLIKYSPLYDPLYRAIHHIYTHN